MKKMILRCVNREVTVHNKREENFVWIWNNAMRMVLEDWVHEAHWRQAFKKDEFRHWRISELGHQASGMYFLDMLEEPLSTVEVFQCIREDVENTFIEMEEAKRSEQRLREAICY